MQERQLLRDPEVRPADGVIAAGLGAAGDAYTAFTDGMESRGVQVDWRYYNDGKAWLGKGLYRWTTARGTQKETTVFWLSIWEGFFKVSIFIPEKAREEALALPLDSELREMVAGAKQMGKLKFFPLVFDVRSEQPLQGIYALIDFRATVK